MIDDPRTRFRAVTADDVARAKATVRDLLIEINGVVGDGQDWRVYLLWDKQLQQFHSNEVGTVDLWHLVHTRVARDTVLFEMDLFQRYRSALQSLIHHIEAYDNPDLKGEYQAVLTELTKLLSRSDGRLQVADAARLSELLTKLDRQQQVPELIEAIRQRARQPNLVIEIPAKVLASDQHFKEDYTFRHFVRGSQVESSGTLEADQSFALDSNENAIVVKADVAGRSDSKSRGFGRGVTVRSSGSLEFKSTSNVSVNIEGVQASSFDTTGTLATEILGVSVRYRGRAATTARQTVFDRQEADRQAAQSGALAELDSTFDARIDNLIAPIQAAYRKNMYLPLIRHDRLPRKSKFVSVADVATMQFWFADEAQLTAPNDPHWSEKAEEQIRIAIHESAVNNTSALLEGRVRSLVSILNGRFFEYIAETAYPSERIDIRFHDEVAVRGILRDGTLEIRLVGTAYIIDGSTYPGMEITLRYRLENESSTVLHLSEPPQVVPHVPTGVERPRFGLRGVALRRILSNLLEENAFDKLDLTEIVLPRPFDQLGKLQTRRIAIEDGWFVVEALPLATGATP
jgi:hypothetical protein